MSTEKRADENKTKKNDRRDQMDFTSLAQAFFLFNPFCYWRIQLRRRIEKIFRIKQEVLSSFQWNEKDMHERRGRVSDAERIESRARHKNSLLSLDMKE